MNHKKFEIKRPISGTWQRIPGIGERLEGEAFLHPLGLQVISSVHVVENNDHSGESPHWHISIADRGGERCPASIIPTILKQFDASDFEEDNHAPMKKIRSFWKRCEGNNVECPCKHEEKAEVHGDYIWREHK